MRRIDFTIPIYDWEVSVVTTLGSEDSSALVEVLNSIEAEPCAVEQTRRCLEQGAKDGGDMWYDTDRKKAFIHLYRWSTEGDFWETINHEKRHLIDRIMQHHRISDTEAAAYLDGYVSKIIFTRLNELR